MTDCWVVREHGGDGFTTFHTTKDKHGAVVDNAGRSCPLARKVSSHRPRGSTQHVKRVRHRPTRHKEAAVKHTRRCIYNFMWDRWKRGPPGRRVVKRRSRVLRRRTRQAALDKPRVHDGQLGFAILEH